MTTRIFGSGIRRREDPRLITGQASYTDDISLNGLVHAAILRSPHGHARITSIDTSAAKSAPGVLAVYTGADIEGKLTPIPCAWVVPDSDVKTVAYPAIAKDVVRYVGDAVAVVVADTRTQAEDALELINVGYEVLPAVVNAEAALQDGAPQLHEDAPNNQAFHWTVAGGDADSAFDSAEVVVRDTIIQQRLIPNAMEPRSTVATWLSALGELTLWNTSQNPHIARFVTSLVTGVPEHKIRVIAPEVGGGVRKQDCSLSVGDDHGVLRHATGSSGQVDRDQVGKLPSHHPRPRPHPARRDGGHEGGENHRLTDCRLRRHGSIPLHGSPWHTYYPPRSHVLRPI